MTEFTVNLDVDDPRLQALLADILIKNSPDLTIVSENTADLLVSVGNDGIRVGQASYSFPVRLGVILNDIKTLQRHKNAKSIDPLMIGGGVFDADRSVFSTEQGDQVKLTEKESAILMMLNDHKGARVGREDLLGYVWGYAKGLETHTVETHIYRLRQKIEVDPANPAIILTDEDGYRIA